MELRIDLPEISTHIKKKICEEPIIYQYMTEVKIYPNGTSYVRSWSIGDLRTINKDNKPKKAKKKILESFSKVDGEEEL